VLGFVMLGSLLSGGFVFAVEDFVSFVFVLCCRDRVHCERLLFWSFLSP
jgi:hypothetical protein